jgi:hypothetical protein
MKVMNYDDIHQIDFVLEKLNECSPEEVTLIEDKIFKGKKHTGIYEKLYRKRHRLY